MLDLPHTSAKRHTVLVTKPCNELGYEKKIIESQTGWWFLLVVHPLAEPTFIDYCASRHA